MSDSKELVFNIDENSVEKVFSTEDRLPDDWEENIYNAMDEAFKLGKFADGGMQNDDTQIGVEFAVRHFKKMLENKNG